jgi:hypothetical protein
MVVEVILLLQVLVEQAAAVLDLQVKPLNQGEVGMVGLERHLLFLERQ